MSVFDNVKQRIASKEVTSAVIGLGYVGLPLAHSMCKKGLQVYGLDIDPQKIEALVDGQSYIDAVPSDAVKQWVSEYKLAPSSDFSTLSSADFIIICVPTPLDSNNEPDLSFVTNTCEEISKYLRAGQTVILESTTYPGTMNDIVHPIFERTGLKEGQDFYLAYSPERENPGSANFSTSTIPKIVGADKPEVLQLVQDYYELFIDAIVPVSSMKVAEASKILENVFRAVNIAMVNELKVIFDHMDIDIWEVIEAAKTKPFGYTPFYPGPGLGGHCIPIDPFYLSWKAKEVGCRTRFIELAGEINTAMPEYVYDKTKEALLETRSMDIKDAKILILGVAYKKNVNDQRETPAFPLMDKLLKNGAVVDYHDPLIPEIKPNRNHPELAGKQSIDWSEQTLQLYDCALIITDHDQFNLGSLAGSDILVVDTRNALAAYKGQPNIIKA